MKRLLILRHAKSSWDDPGVDDHDRPLNRRGVHDAPRMGRLLRDMDVVPDWIVSSTATRARETAVAVAGAAGYAGDLCLARDLYDGGAREYAERIRATPDAVERLLIVGHNPAVEELLALLTGASESMPTAAVAVVDTGASEWRDVRPGSARLAELWRPKELDEE
jgi:phosphohistidine phosphatase